MPEERTQYVYFIQAGENGPIKIGTTNNILGRFRELQVGNHEKLRVLSMLEGGKEKETELHQSFGHFRLRGEWFRPEKELLEFLGNPDPSPKQENRRLGQTITTFLDFRVNGAALRDWIGQGLPLYDDEIYVNPYTEDPFDPIA